MVETSQKTKLSYGVKMSLQYFPLGNYFSHGGFVYQIVDEAKQEPLYIVLQVGRIENINRTPEFVKLGHRSPMVMRKSLVVRAVYF